MASDPGRRSSHALGVDFGTSNTVAVARWPDGRAKPLLIDGSPLLPSAVYAEPDGQLIVGRDAIHSARLDPARFEPNPKRCVDDGTVLLGDREVPVVELIAAVLSRVAEEWRRTVGPVPTEVTLTCPATWGATRRTLLADAAARAGLHGARLVAEPVAAATYFAEVLGREVPIGSVVVVHDFGAGTFDASVVARTAEGFEVLAVDGRDDIGGLDVDAAIVEHLGELCRQQNAQAWEQLTLPSTVQHRRAQRQLWDDVRVAKERLSRTQSADLVVPLVDVEMHVTRDELESLAGPLLSQTVQVTQNVIRWVGVAEGRLAGVFLVGGASRIPLVATLLHRALGEAPVVIEQPELVVAEGSLLADAALLASGPAAPGLTGEMRLVSGMSPEARREPDAPPTTVQDVPPRPQPTLVDLMLPPVELPAADSPAPDAADPTRPVSPAGITAADTALTAFASPAAPLLSPAVDPWPHARDDTWARDDGQTVISGSNPFTSHSTGATSPVPTARSSPVSPARPSPMGPSTMSAAGLSATSAAGPSSRPPAGRAPGSPAGRAQATAPARPSTAAPSSRPGVGAARVSPRTSGAVPPASADAARGGPGRAGAARERPAAAPRRRGGFLRSVRVLLGVTISVLTLVMVPVAATLLAYGYGNDLSIQEDARSLAAEVADLLGFS